MSANQSNLIKERHQHIKQHHTHMKKQHLLYMQNNPPTYVCLKGQRLKPFLQKNGLYISYNKAKYTGNPDARDSLCFHRKLSWNYKNGHIDLETYLKEYEKFARTSLPHFISILAGRVLGCWCESEDVCHGGVLIKLYKERWGITESVDKMDEPEKTAMGEPEITAMGENAMDIQEPGTDTVDHSDPILDAQDLLWLDS